MSSVFLLLPLCAYFGWPINVIGCGFITMGLGMLLPIAVTANWVIVTADVFKIEKAKVIYKYRLLDDEYFGETTTLSDADPQEAGYKIRVFVNPDEPAENFTHFFAHLFIGTFLPLGGLGLVFADAFYLGNGV